MVLASARKLEDNRGEAAADDDDEFATEDCEDNEQADEVENEPTEVESIRLPLIRQCPKLGEGLLAVSILDTDWEDFFKLE